MEACSILLATLPALYTKNRLCKQGPSGKYIVQASVSMGCSTAGYSLVKAGWGVVYVVQTRWGSTEAVLRQY
jgi:hypothetical protein